ncbi:MAG: PAS domain S-box protein [Armatimonadota bacterium]
MSEEQIRELQRARYQAISAGVIVQSPDGTIMHANRAACDMLGLECEEILGRNSYDPIWRTIHEDGSPMPGNEHPAMVALCTQTPQKNVVVGLYSGPHGAQRWLLVSAVPIHDPDTGNMKEVLVTFIDITDRMRAEKSLTRRTRQMELLSKTSQAINTVLNTEAVLRTLVVCARELVDASSGAAGLLIDGKMMFKEYDSGDGIIPIDYSFGPREGIPGWVMVTRKPYITNDAQHDPNVVQSIRTTLNFRSLIDVPIISMTGELLGCFEIHNKHEDKPFDQEDVTALQGLAASAAIALDNSRMLLERKRTQEALQEAESKYRSLVEESLAGVYVIQGGKLVYANPRAAEMHGYPQEEVVGKDVLDLVVPEDRAKVVENIRRRLSGEVGSVHYTLKGLRKDGSQFDIEVYGSITIYQGQPAIIGTELDISERKRAEDALRLDEARLEALLQLSQMTDATLQEICAFALKQIINLTKSEFGYLAFTNEDEAVLNVCVWSTATLLRCSISDKPTAYPEELAGLWGEAMRQRKPIITNDYVGPNPYKPGLSEGRAELVRHMNVPVFDEGRIVAVAGVGNKEEDYDESDVRQLSLILHGMWRLLQKRRTALEMKESEERYRLLFERSPDVVMVLKNDRFIDVSSASLRTFGYLPEELIGTTPWRLSPEHQNDGTSSEEKALMYIRLAETSGPQIFEWTHLTKSGNSIYCQVSLTAFEMAGETYVLAIVRDITDKKLAENTRRKLEKHVEEQKRQFYHETILSVTQGKLDICDAREVRPYISSARIRTEVRDASEVGPARRQVEHYCASQGLVDDRLHAFIIAVGEAITNSVKHGGWGRVYAGIDDGCVWVGVTDRGAGIESLILPRATLLRGFSTKPSLGLGYSIMLEVCDSILLKTGDRGTTVILFKKIIEPDLKISADQLPDTWSSIPNI